MSEYDPDDTRKACNNLTREERESLFNEAMCTAYGGDKYAAMKRKADAYPRLVMALKKYHANGFLNCEKLLKELGELE